MIAAPDAARLAGHGLAVAVPAGWDGRISRRGGGGPVLHVATFPLHPHDGDYGAAATGRMRGDDAFAALIEFTAGPQVRPGSGLFGDRGWRPRLRLAQFGPAQLQVTRPGQIGAQRFFTEAGRAFCLYSVIAPVRVRPQRLLDQLAAVLGTVRFSR